MMEIKMKKILIIEDDKDIARLLVTQLRSQYQMLIAFDAVQGFRIMQQEKPDLLLLDVNVPAGSGISIAEKTLELPHLAGTPFIFISGNKDPAIYERALSLGAAAFFNKPWNAQELLDTIKKTIGE